MMVFSSIIPRLAIFLLDYGDVAMQRLYIFMVNRTEIFTVNRT